MEEVVGDADEPAVEPRGQPMQLFAFHQAAPSVVVVGVGQHSLVEGVVADGKRLPSLPVGLAKWRDLDHAVLVTRSFGRRPASCRPYTWNVQHAASVSVQWIPLR